MTILQFDHIGIIAKSIEIGEAHFKSFHPNIVFSELYEEKNQDVFIKFASTTGPLRYEIIAPRSENSPVLKSLEKKVNILNHLAYRVPDLNAASTYFKQLKAMPLTKPLPSSVFNGSLIQFWMTPLGLIYELIEDAGLKTS